MLGANENCVANWSIEENAFKFSSSLKKKQFLSSVAQNHLKHLMRKFFLPRITMSADFTTAKVWFLESHCGINFRVNWSFLNTRELKCSTKNFSFFATIVNQWEYVWMWQFMCKFDPEKHVTTLDIRSSGGTKEMFWDYCISVDCEEEIKIIVFSNRFGHMVWSAFWISFTYH